MVTSWTNVYINNLTTQSMTVAMSWIGNALPSGDWAALETALAPFDATHHKVAWVSRGTGVTNGETFTLQLQVSSPAEGTIVQGVITLTGTFAGSDMVIGAQNQSFSDLNLADNSASNTWTSPTTGDQWAIEFGFTNANRSTYDDVYYTLFTVVGDQGA